MRVRSLLVTSLAAAALVVAPVAPVAAQAGATITASPTDPKPGDGITVAGTTDCASVAYTVTLTYTNPAGDDATATATGTTDASGEFTQAITVPETTVAGEPANVTASVECSGGAQTTEPTALDVQAHEGTWTVDPNIGPAGTEVSFTGANCWGDDIVIGFGDGDEFPFEVTDVTLNDDRTFTATFTIPDEAGPGEYAFFASCPGTDYPLAPFTVTGEGTDGEGEGEGGGVGTGGTGAEENAPPAGPPMPVAGNPTFTG